MLIATKMQAMFYKLIAFGLGTVYITQVFLTIGGATKFIPSTGVTLPFVSYGGSSVLATFILFNIIQGLYILKRGEEEEDEKDQAKSQGQIKISCGLHTAWWVCSPPWDSIWEPFSSSRARM